MDSLSAKSQKALDHEHETARPGRSNPGNLRDQVAVSEGRSKWHIPTPTSADVYSGNMESSQQSDDSMHSVSLPDFVSRFPTPSTMDYTEKITTEEIALIPTQQPMTLEPLLTATTDLDCGKTEGGVIDEATLLTYLNQTQQPIIVEPPYRRKYPPMALAKIAGHLKQRGVPYQFVRQYGFEQCDVAFVTSLFTYDAPHVLATIEAIHSWQPNATIIVGGIYATLMTKHIRERCPYVLVFSGYSKHLDQLDPVYDHDWHIEEPWEKFSFVFTTRGCPSRCAYCAVPRIEPGLWINPRWKDLIDEHPYTMISDNNLSSMPEDHLRAVIDHLQKTGKRVVFDNGFDCKFITDEMAGLLAKLRYTRSGMRMAFDRIEEDGVFQQAVERLKKAGVPKSQITAYCLFNFNDRPQDANYRMETCKNLGIRPYPQRFAPLNQVDRKGTFTGKYWTHNLARIFRHFWLMAGYNSKMTFPEFAMRVEELTKGKMQMAPEDWAAWEKERQVIKKASGAGSYGDYNNRVNEWS